jgi:hypothetical protein
MMRRLLAFLIVLGLAGMAYASEVDLGSEMTAVYKSDSHVRQNPGTMDGREGGETLATAYPIGSLPFIDNGNTCDNINDYDYACPYTGSTSPDVVYVFSPATNISINVDLCLSGYDTKVYIYANAVGTPIACNDDFYTAAPCYTFSSFLGAVPLTAGNNYYIVVDGYGGDCGDYTLEVTEYIPPEPVPCPDDGVLEGEPHLYNGYVDNWDGGCNSTPPAWNRIYDWRTIYTDCGWLCGRAGWYTNAAGGSSRDTDWYPITAGGTSMAYTVWAAQPTNIYVLNACYPTCVPAPAVLYSATTGGGWASATLTWATSAGQQFVLWAGSNVFAPPSGGTPQEYDYVAEVCGHMAGTIPNEDASWGNVKSLYR